MMPEINDEKELVRILKALANPIRIKIISYLSREPMCVYDLAKALKLSYPLTFLHVKILRDLGLIKEVRREESTKGLLPTRYYHASDFEITLSAENIRRIVEGGRNGNG